MRTKLMIVPVLFLLLSTPLFAQQGPPGGNPGGPGGLPDFQQIRKQMSDRLKQQLGSSDDEWKVVEPKIEKVFILQADTSGRAIGMSLLFGFNISAMMAGPDAAPSDVQKAASDLYETLSNTSASPSEIKVKFAAFTAAKTKAKANLAKAQEDLRSVLTSRQEAQLVLLGMLE